MLSEVEEASGRRRLGTPAAVVGGGIRAVAAGPHVAPAPGAVLGAVEEVEHALRGGRSAGPGRDPRGTGGRPPPRRSAPAGPPAPPGGARAPRRSPRRPPPGRPGTCRLPARAARSPARASRAAPASPPPRRRPAGGARPGAPARPRRADSPFRRPPQRGQRRAGRGAVERAGPTSQPARSSRPVSRSRGTPSTATSVFTKSSARWLPTKTNGEGSAVLMARSISGKRLG